MDVTQQQRLVEAFANRFINGERFDTIVSARNLAESILSEKITPGTITTKLVDEAVEQGIVQAARNLARVSDSLQCWEQCLDLYDRQPALNTRTSTSVLQQAYSTPIPIAYLAGLLAQITPQTTVYEPTAGNGALLLLASPSKAIVNEINPNRAAALRAQGFTVTEQDASSFLPQVEAVDRIITNPPFGSLLSAQGQTRMFRHGLLTTSQLDHAIALKALDLLKPEGKAVLILGGKMGDEQSRTERYNTQLTRGFYRWLYKDAGYQVEDHFSIAGSVYRKQGTTFPIDVIVIGGKGETRLKLPGVQPPRIYESYEALKEVLDRVIQQQQSLKQNLNPLVTLQRVYTEPTLDTGIPYGHARGTSPALDISASPISVESDREPRGVLFPADAASRVADRASYSRLASDIRAASGARRIGVGSYADNGISTPVFKQPDATTKPSADGTVPGDELPGATAAMLDNRGSTVSRHPTPDAGAEPQLPGRYESHRLVGMDERRRSSAQFSGLNVMAETEPRSLAQEQDLENQISYKPRSKAFSLSTLIPATSIKGLETAFNKIEATTGMSVDEYVRSRLNEPSQETLFKHYAAEQIDSLALAIYNHEFEKTATLIGHDTGVGKTRIICGLARYAQEHGMISVIVTVDPVLYGDILARDAVDTGNSFHPLITNNNLNISLKTPDGRQLGQIRNSPNHHEKIKEYAQAGNIGEHDCLFTTYGQLTGSASISRRQLLEALAPRSFLILDESHKAGGAAGEQRPETKAEKANKEREGYVPSCTEFFQKLVTQSSGFVASSATAIKDPIVAARLFYETTDLRLAAPDRETFTEHLKTGGVPLQQQVFAMWASSGSVIRCEKSYEGVEFGVEKVPVSLQTAENNSRILNLIWRFDQTKESAVERISADFAEAGEAAKEKNPALGEAGATSTIFTSVLHNLTAVTSLGLKAEATANEVIKDIEQGRKPIIMLFNTMESTIKNFIDTHNELADAHNAQFSDQPMQRIEVGDAVRIDAGELFTRYLEKSRTIKITEPYLDELTGKQKTRSHRLSDGELGAVGVAAYNRAANAIAAADWSKLPISPIDYIKQKIEDAFYSIGEITGRTHVLKYSSAGDIQAGVVTYGTREHGTAQKKQVMDDFQNGRVDAVITNSTTGYSLHAARTVADQRQRVMYILQPHLDVNQVEQSIGRSHRSGQVDPHQHPPDKFDERGQPMWGQYPGSFGLPIFKLVVGQDLPTEERAVAILMKKMSHLKANTTGNRSSSFGLKDMPDFINDYGNEVAVKLMTENPDLHVSLDCPLGSNDELDVNKAIQKVTGRAVMLTSDEAPTPEKPYPSLARQAWLYDTLTSEYKEFLAQKIALGENELEAQKLDLQAEPVQRLILNPGNPEIDSPFTKPAYLVEVRAKTGAKPNTTLQVVNAVRQELGFEPIADLTEHDDYSRSDVREKGRSVAQETANQLRSDASEFLSLHVKAKESEISVFQGRVEKYQSKLEAQLAIQAGLTQRQAEASTAANVPMQEQLRVQLQQQQPKIEQLEKQLNKAKLELNAQQFQLALSQQITKATIEDVSQLLVQLPVGQGVRLTDNTTKNSLYGVVTAVEQKQKANNPASPINWKLKLLVVDGVRSISVGLDSLLKSGKQTLSAIETAPGFVNSQQESSVYELFDERQTEAKEKRYLVSGQVLSTQLTGKFAQITDSLGQVHPVYLLQRGFDPEKALNRKPVKLETTEQVKQFLFEKTEKAGVVQTADENLTIIADINRSNAGGVVLKTAKATSQGGLYFKDEGLIQLTGDFISKTEAVRQDGTTKSHCIMTVSVPSEKVDQVLTYVAQKWEVGAASHKNAAREMLGQALPKWSPCHEINPDIERVVVPRISQVTDLARHDLRQRVFNASSASAAITDEQTIPVEVTSSTIDTRTVSMVTHYDKSDAKLVENTVKSELPLQSQESLDNTSATGIQKATTPLESPKAEAAGSQKQLETERVPSINPVSPELTAVKTDSLLSASHSSFQEELPTQPLKVQNNAPERTLSSKLDDFFQGQMSLTEALKLASEAEQLQSPLAPVQSSRSASSSKSPTPKTSKHSEETRTQQLSLFAITDETAFNANPSESINSSSRVQSPSSSNANKPKLPRAVSSQSNAVQQSLSFEQSLRATKPPLPYSAQLTTAQPLKTLSSNAQTEPNQSVSLSTRPLIEAINQLNDSEFIRLERSVMEYFSTAPPQPTSQSQQQLVHQEIEQIVTQISSLWIRQAQQVELVEKLKKNPFSAWNKNYQEAVNQLESTMETISQAITQKEQRENQVQQWHKQAETFSSWKTAPRTVQMQELMEILKLTQMSGRLINIQQTQQHHDQPNQPQRRPLKR